MTIKPTNTTEPISAVLIAGPTASGKSDVALGLAERLNGTIINADAMQVYEGLRILTARPDAADEARIPHRLYGTVPASTAFSVGDWTAAATEAAREVTQEGRLPIFVGGTGMYLSVLSEGISPMPDIPESIRSEVRGILERESLEALYQKVCAVDEASAERIGATDPQRLMRALEVFQATGEPLTTWQKKPREKPFEGKFARIVLEPERQWIYDRIERRFDSMMAKGALEEVEALARRGLAPDLPLMKALGVEDLMRVQCGDSSLDEAVTEINTKTRRFAKRQMTWFRNQMITWNRVYAQEMISQVNDSFAIIIDSGLTLPK